MEQVQMKEHLADDAPDGVGCAKTVVECPEGCGIQGLWREEMPAHRQASCPKRVVDCDFGCGARMMWIEVAEHRTDKCPIRPVSCKFGCGVTRSLDRMEDHYVNCEQRETECPVGCDEPVPLHILKEHVASLCPARTVRCRLGCSSEMEARLRPQHEEEACPLREKDCKWVSARALILLFGLLVRGRRRAPRLTAWSLTRLGAAELWRVWAGV